MIAGVATDTIVVSIMIMKKPRTNAQRAGHGSFCSVGGTTAVGWAMNIANTRGGTITP